jgi:hypothetical protein
MQRLTGDIFPDPFRSAMATARLAYFVVVGLDSCRFQRPR